MPGCCYHALEGRAVVCPAAGPAPVFDKNILGRNPYAFFFGCFQNNPDLSVRGKLRLLIGTDPDISGPGYVFFIHSIIP